MTYLRSVTNHALRIVACRTLDLTIVILLTVWLYSARKV